MPTLYPNSGFLVSGVNLNFVEKVRVGEESVKALTYLASTGISGKVPEGSFSSEVFVDTSTSVVSAGEVNVILRPDDQVSVGEIKEWSGRAGNLVSITGANFHQITNVNFGDAAAEFYKVNSQQLNLVVPQNSSWDVIRVSSSLRTGLNGDTSISSGNSPASNKFVPIPEVVGLSTGQQVTGGTVNIIGRNFGGATGVSFNDITSTASVVGANLQTTVPSGDVWGKVGVLLQSGLVASGNTDLEFKSLARLTGYGPNGAASSQEIDGVTTYVGVGDTIRLSGENFIPEILYDSKGTDLSASGYLVGFGGDGATGLFNLVDDRVMSGIVPSTVPTGSGSLFLYSNRYPETFPSDVNFFPKYSPPSITSVVNEYNATTNPASGIAGNTLTVKGNNLFHITGAAITGGALGIGTYGTSSLIGGPAGTSVRVVVGTDISTIYTHQAYNVTLSGTYGDVTGVDQFVGYGAPTISTIDPVTDIAPNATGVITGTNLYSGASAILVKDTIGNEYRELPCSGFVSDYTECKFTYPTSFPQGSYKLKVRNQRAQVLKNTVLGVYHSPQLSGFTPAQVTVAETTVTVSGFFEQVTGVRVGEVDLEGFTTQSNGANVSGVEFVVNEDVGSDKIGVFTRGGNVFSETNLVVVPGKPIVSGYWVGKKGSEKPATINYDQVVAAGGNIHVSGRRLDLIEKLEVSGESSKFTSTLLGGGTYEGLDFSVPNEINPNSGLFNFVDYLDRTGTFDTSCDGSGLNVFSLTGLDQWKVPGSSIVASGNNLSGLNVLFSGGNNDEIAGYNISSSGIDLDPVNGIETISIAVPTGILNSSLATFTGQSNLRVYTTPTALHSLAVVSGVKGLTAGAINTGSNFIITGVNFQSSISPVSGDPVALISGTGYQNGVTGETTGGIFANLYETGLSGTNSSFISVIQSTSNTEFIGTGNLILLNGGNFEDHSFSSYPKLYSNFASSPSAPYQGDQIDYFSETVTLNGTWVDATGFGPSMGITGSTVEISGQGFNAVSGVYFSTEKGTTSSALSVPVEGNIIQRATDITINSDNKITVKVPRVAVSQRTDTQILISGGTNDSIGPFSVLPDAPGFVSNVVELDEFVPSPSAGQSVKAVKKVLENGETYLQIYEEVAPGKFIIIGTEIDPGG
jgi:hypothetical protein